MAKKPYIPEPSPEARKALRAEYGHLLEIEGNPLAADEKAMFEMFDQKGFTTEQRLAFISELFAARSSEDHPVRGGDRDVG